MSPCLCTPASPSIPTCHTSNLHYNVLAWADAIKPRLAIKFSLVLFSLARLHVYRAAYRYEQYSSCRKHPDPFPYAFMLFVGVIHPSTSSRRWLHVLATTPRFLRLARMKFDICSPSSKQTIARGSCSTIRPGPRTSPCPPGRPFLTSSICSETRTSSNWRQSPQFFRLTVMATSLRLDLAASSSARA